jgi:hypothetical protein
MIDPSVEFYRLAEQFLLLLALGAGFSLLSVRGVGLWRRRHTLTNRDIFREFVDHALYSAAVTVVLLTIGKSAKLIMIWIDHFFTLLLPKEISNR